MAPEAIAPFDVQDIDDESLTVQGKKTNVPKMRLGRSSDIWSLGCILYQIIYGSPPFASLNTIQKLTTIPNPRHNIKYPSHEDLDAIDSIRACLIYDPHMRAKIKGEAGCLTSRAYLSINRYRDLPLTLNSTTGDILKANTVQPSLGCLSKVLEHSIFYSL